MSETEWDRYEALMEGPRGRWSPDLDPLWVLGIHARTEAERTRYAEMAVQQEHLRVEGELAFQRAYSAAWNRLYPGERVLDPALMPSAGALLPQVQAGDRLLLFVSLDCCERLAGRLAEQIRGAHAGLDIYVAGADESQVRAWARRASIPPELVAERTVTLNLDNGALERLTAGGTAPLLIRLRLGQYTALSLEGLL